MIEYLKKEVVQTIERADTLREVADQTFYISSHNIVTPGQPVLALTYNVRRLAAKSSKKCQF